MASAKCISSIVVRTPSLQLGVLQSLRGSFQTRLISPSHLVGSYSTTGGIWSEDMITSPSPSKAAQVRHKGVNPFTNCASRTPIPIAVASSLAGMLLPMPRPQHRTLRHVLATLQVSLPPNGAASVQDPLHFLCLRCLSH